MSARNEVRLVAHSHGWEISTPVWAASDDAAHFTRGPVRVTVLFSAGGAVRSASASQVISADDPRAATAFDRLWNDVRREADGLLRVRLWGLSPKQSQKRETLIEHLRGAEFTSAAQPRRPR